MRPNVSTYRHIVKVGRICGLPRVLPVPVVSFFAALSIVAPVGSAVAEESDQVPLPTTTGRVFVLDDFDDDVTRTDLGVNRFAGNSGAIESGEGLVTLSLATSAEGGSLRFEYDFSGEPDEGPFAGLFESLFGLTATKVSLNGDGGEPAEATPFPGYYLDLGDLYRSFLPWPDRSVEEIRFRVRRDSAEPISLKIELKDEAGFDVFAMVDLGAAMGQWQDIMLDLPNGSSPGAFIDSIKGAGDPVGFDRHTATLLTLIVERKNVGAGVDNPTVGNLLIDDLQLVDLDGAYPDLAAAQDAQGRLRYEYTDAYLDLVRATSFLYFLDWSSTDPRTGGIVQDRGTFADLMTVGGVGFQLTAYVVAAEAGYITRAEAAANTHAVLTVLHDGPQGPDRVGTTGYKGFFYHFLGIDGHRKQNFDFEATSLDESLNTVELSTIDTALALVGVITAGEYFTGANATETEIGALADAIYRRVDWRFMLDRKTDQFMLGWKPNETRDDDSGRYGRFRLDDADSLGQYSSRPNAAGAEIPATLDFYTDEAVLIALLAIASPEPTHRVDPEVFCAMQRDTGGGSFVRTFPGSLFTYQFASAWLNTRDLGFDKCTRPMNYFANTTSAVEAAIAYAEENPAGHASLSRLRWGLSATEGPYDAYFAEAAPPLALATEGGCFGSDSVVARPLEVGTVTVYGVGSSILHAPQQTVSALWEAQRLGLLHPRFGFDDAFNLDIAEAAVEDCVDQANDEILRTSGPWAQVTGFAIDHGPMLVMVDNYLRDRFVPKLFGSNPHINGALDLLFGRHFSDVPADHLFVGNIEWLARQGVTKGCNPPNNDQFCPSDYVTRGQMAAFLVRALSYTDDGGGDLFTDDNTSILEADIDKLGTAGVTKGCNPPNNDQFCPSDYVTRGQMAAFLHRAMG